MSEQPRFWRKPTEEDITETLIVLFLVGMIVGVSAGGVALGRWIKTMLVCQ
jgi:hypothetical protein